MSSTEGTNTRLFNIENREVLMGKEERPVDPDIMTSAERLERIIEILVRGGLRLYWEGEGTMLSKPESVKFEMPVPYKGRIPFGQRKAGVNRERVELEQAIIKQIRELKTKGYSTEKIAQQLNQEDHASRRSGKWTRVAVWRILKRNKKGVTK